MNFTELYETFDIKPAEFMVNETNEEFGRRYLSSYSLQTEQKGVIYSTGSAVHIQEFAKTNQDSYQLYSY